MTEINRQKLAVAVDDILTVDRIIKEPEKYIVLIPELYTLVNNYPKMKEDIKESDILKKPFEYLEAKIALTHLNMIIDILNTLITMGTLYEDFHMEKNIEQKNNIAVTMVGIIIKSQNPYLYYETFNTVTDELIDLYGEAYYKDFMLSVSIAINILEKNEKDFQDIGLIDYISNRKKGLGMEESISKKTYEKINVDSMLGINISNYLTELYSQYETDIKTFDDNQSGFSQVTVIEKRKNLSFDLIGKNVDVKHVLLELNN